MSMPPSPWAPRPGYRRSRALPRSSSDLGPLPGAGRYHVHERPQTSRAPSSDLRDIRGDSVRQAFEGLIPPSILAMVGAVILTAVICIFSIYTVIFFADLGREYGPVLFPAFRLALIPLMVVLAVTIAFACVFWYVRWEPRPPGLFAVVTLAMAFLWGASVSTLCSMVVNTAVDRLIAEAMGGAGVASVISAPLVEELTKGLGVLFVFLIWRKTINGAIDGVVYAACTAAGFAFVENILYFVQGWCHIEEIFVMRGLLSPFAHLTFTACIGVSIGISSRRRSKHAWAWMAPVGLIGAITLHAVWNGIIAVSITNFGMYLLLQVPFYSLCVGLVLWLRRGERQSMRRELDDYARAGWFAPAEVQMLTTGAGRRAGRRWAVTRGPQAFKAMTAFQRGAAELAQLRQQAVDGYSQEDFSTRETELLNRINSARRAFIGTV